MERTVKKFSLSPPSHPQTSDTFRTCLLLLLLSPWSLLQENEERSSRGRGRTKASSYVVLSLPYQRGRGRKERRGKTWNISDDDDDEACALGSLIFICCVFVKRVAKGFPPPLLVRSLSPTRYSLPPYKKSGGKRGAVAGVRRGGKKHSVSTGGGSQEGGEIWGVGGERESNLILHAD